MNIIKSKLNTRSHCYQQNYAQMAALSESFTKKTSTAQLTTACLNFKKFLNLPKQMACVCVAISHA